MLSISDLVVNSNLFGLTDPSKCKHGCNSVSCTETELKVGVVAESHPHHVHRDLQIAFYYIKK